VATTYDAGEGTVRLYFNGIEDASLAVGSGRLIDSSLTDLLIGAVFTGGGIFENFAGLIDEVSIYNRALSAAEIAAIFNAGSAGKCKEGAGGVGGTVTGLQPALIVCENLSTEQVVVIWEQAPSWNCETAGLAVTPDDIIRITLVGGAQ
jgi:hypothetical protein